MGPETFRLRHAYGELASLARAKPGVVMDSTSSPTRLYWGPNGMVFFRNVQFRWMPLKGQFSDDGIERSGASGDQGVFADRNELQGISQI